MNVVSAIKYIWYKPAPNIWLRAKVVSYSLGSVVIETIYTGERFKGYPDIVGKFFAIFQRRVVLVIE